MLDCWDETVTAQTVCESQEAGSGCLLQIHPLKLSDNLIELSAGPTLIGRESGCGVCLPDASVSRQHALIDFVDGAFRIQDLNSTNGVQVNEQTIEDRELTPGDRIQIGGFIFKYLQSNHIEMQYHEAVYSMMTRDGLTGTLNKRSFLDLLKREYHRAVHRRLPLSLILFDIDHFKQVNDQHGHLAGDDVLKEISQRIGTVVAEHDIFARYGGEEFAILLPGVDREESSKLAELCRQVVEGSLFTTSAGLLPITISVGVADLNGLSEPDSEDRLVDAADQKLYDAKRTGRNRVCR